MIIEFWNDLRYGDTMDKAIAGTMLFCIFPVLVGLIILGLVIAFIAIDSTYLPIRKEDGVIERKVFTPSVMTMVPITTSTGNATITTLVPTIISEGWSVHVRYGGKLIACPVTAARYHGAAIGAPTGVLLKTGRISRSLYCEGIE